MVVIGGVGGNGCFGIHENKVHRLANLSTPSQQRVRLN